MGRSEGAILEIYKEVGEGWDMGWGGFRNIKTNFGRRKRSGRGWEFWLENIPKSENCQEVEKGCVCVCGNIKN